MSIMTEREYQERLEFLTARQAGVGTSDLWPLLTGEALDVYHSKTRKITEEDVVEGRDSIHLLRGNLLEPHAADFYWRMTGRQGRRETGQVFHPQYPGAMASPDGTIFDGARALDDEDEIMPGTGYLELKAPGLHVFGNLVDQGTRDSIIYQLQYGVAVRRKEWGSFGFFNLEHSRGPLIPVDVIASPEIGQFCLEIVAEFWTEHVEPRIPPDPETWALLLEKAPPALETSGQVVTVEDEEAATILRLLVDASETEREAKATKKEAQSALDDWMQENVPDSDRIQVPNVGKATRIRAAGRETLDLDALRDHRPMDRDAFVRFCRDEAGGFTEEEIEDAADRAALDLDRFMKEGSPYSYVRAYPAKK